MSIQVSAASGALNRYVGVFRRALESSSFGAGERYSDMTL